MDKKEAEKARRVSDASAEEEQGVALRTRSKKPLPNVYTVDETKKTNPNIKGEDSCKYNSQKDEQTKAAQNSSLTLINTGNATQVSETLETEFKIEQSKSNGIDRSENIAKREPSEERLTLRLPNPEMGNRHVNDWLKKIDKVEQQQSEPGRRHFLNEVSSEDEESSSSSTVEVHNVLIEQAPQKPKTDGGYTGPKHKKQRIALKSKLAVVSEPILGQVNYNAEVIRHMEYVNNDETGDDRRRAGGGGAPTIKVFGNEYIIGKVLGSGGQGRVCKGFDVGSERFVACKISPMLTDKAQKAAILEATVLRHTHHPNIIRMFESAQVIPVSLMILELCIEDLFDFIGRQRRPLPEQEAIVVARQMTLGVNYIHRLGIIHRDIKPLNFLLSHSGSTYGNACSAGVQYPFTIKLADFGLCKIVSENEPLRGTVGTPFYCPPEVTQYRKTKERYLGKPVDVFALGLSIFELVASNQPFVSKVVGAFLKKRHVGEKYLVPRHVSQPCASLLDAMLHPVATSRVTMATVLASKWLNSSEWPEKADDLTHESILKQRRLKERIVRSVIAEGIDV